MWISYTNLSLQFSLFQQWGTLKLQPMSCMKQSLLRWCTLEPLVVWIFEVGRKYHNVNPHIWCWHHLLWQQKLLICFSLGLSISMSWTLLHHLSPLWWWLLHTISGIVRYMMGGSFFPSLYSLFWSSMVA